jgi:hypothetical protein
MAKTWVFTLKKFQTPDNIFNKELARKLPLPGTTTKGEPRVFTPEIKTTKDNVLPPPLVANTAAKTSIVRHAYFSRSASNTP